MSTAHTRLRTGSSLLLSAIISAAWSTAPADDLAPANFREHRGARMDHWEYTQPETHSNEENWAPEHSTGEPPGNMKKPETTGRTFWERTYGGRPGVWRVDAADGAVLDFTIPNVMDPRAPKAVIVQVTWWPTSNQTPVVDVVNGNTNNDFEVPEDFPPETTALDDGWKHTRYHFWSDTCPSHELIRIQPPPNGVLYVDQVVVDAQCIVPFKHGNDGDGGVPGGPSPPGGPTPPDGGTESGGSGANHPGSAPIVWALVAGLFAVCTLLAFLWGRRSGRR